jgi:hypothetical protein
MSFLYADIRPQITVARTLVLAFSAALGLGPLAELSRAAEPARQVWVRLDSELLVPLIERPIEEEQAVDEVILGVRSMGNAQISAVPQVKVADDADKAAFSVTVTGTIHSRTSGQKGPVRIYSRSTTHFTATKRVAFQPGRGFVGEAAEISAQSDCRPERIAPNQRGVLGRVIERRAWARVAESRQQVNQIVQAKAEAKIRAAFDRMVEARLAKVNRLAERRDLVGTVLGRPQYVCWTRGGWLNIALTSDAKSSAVDANRKLAPALETALQQHGTLATDGPPIQVWVHEQVLGERLATVFRRVESARKRLRQLQSFVATQTPADSPVAFVTQATPNSSYDFQVCGDWIVIHVGDPKETPQQLEVARLE